MHVQGMPQGEPIEPPKDPYFLRRKAAGEKVLFPSLLFLACARCVNAGMRMHTRNLTPAQIHCQQVAIKSHGDQRQRFLAFNRKVLRFYCLWDDRHSIYGERRPFILHFYLEDDTVEVLDSSLRFNRFC